MASTVGLVGVGIGAVPIGPLTDRFGRRGALISQHRAVLRAHPRGRRSRRTSTQFTVLRFLAGLGLGACLPTALAFMTEHARAGRGGSAVTRMMTGYHVGAVLTALLALWLVDAYGWESMFVVGGVVGLLTLPVLWAQAARVRDLPARGRARASGSRPRRACAAPTWSAAATCGSASACGSPRSWACCWSTASTPGCPRSWARPATRSSAGTGLLLVLNVGAVIGLLVAGGVSDTRGNKPTVLAWFGLAAVFLALLSIRMESSLLVYAAVLLAGVFVFSAQVLVYAFVGHLYPTEIRGTALGMAAGVGRVGAIVGPFLGGALVTAGIAYPWGFYAFAVAAVLAVLALLATVPAHLRDEA